MAIKNIFKRFPFSAQHDAMDCGPACLKMIAEFYGKKFSLQFIRQHSYFSRDGVSLAGLSQAAETMGFESAAFKYKPEDLIINEIYPSVLYWNNCHFVVLYDVKKALFSQKKIYRIADPAAGLFDLNEDDLKKNWCAQNGEGIVFALEPGENFHQKDSENDKNVNIVFSKKYLTPYVSTVSKLFLCLVFSGILSLTLPYLTQALIDSGVSSKNIDIVSLILLAQTAIFAGTTVIEIIRNRLVLFMGTKINISIISDFFYKILKLPLKFFDTKFLGDFYQRIQDHSRIEYFLTSQTLTTFFSLVNFCVFFIVLFNYDSLILLSYISLTLISVLWSRYFLRKREIIDYLRFRTNALNQESVNEMIGGIQDIKLNNFEDYKISKWEDLQSEVFSVNLKALKLDQMQLSGFDFINQFKNIFVTYLAAKLVISGSMTVGGMLSVSYIIGQLNSPVSQLITFFRSFQDAKLSMSRLSEVQTMEEEQADKTLNSERQNNKFNGIELRNVTFQYEGPLSPKVLDNLSLKIPKGKTTAIVGLSGSGKTTILKLLLNFYSPISGEIFTDGTPLQTLNPALWRKQCGTVMQDGFIFAETLERNIATSEEKIDTIRLKNAIETAHLQEFVNLLPQKEKTMMGAMGNGISGGQKQRLLIARAVYKNPEYIFLDEATSALDTENENIIHKNLQQFFRGKTVVIIAHRLSTVKNADNIVVLSEGKITESGTHKQLICQKGIYFNLIKDQLENTNE